MVSCAEIIRNKDKTYKLFGNDNVSISLSVVKGKYNTYTFKYKWFDRSNEKVMYNILEVEKELNKIRSLNEKGQKILA